MSAWPLTTLPNAEDYTQRIIGNVLRSQMEYGQVKTRRMNTKGRKVISLTFTITRTELATFETWYEDTIHSGNDIFTMDDPIDGTNRQYRFSEDPSITGFDSKVKLGVVLEQML